MSIIGGKIGQKKDVNFTHMVSYQLPDTGELKEKGFFTIRHARNWIRENGFNFDNVSVRKVGK